MQILSPSDDPSTFVRARPALRKERSVEPAVRWAGRVEIDTACSAIVIADASLVTSPASDRTKKIAIGCKRVIDGLCAASLLVVLAIPMALIAVLVKATSRGPAFYSQPRVGLNGRLFRIHKFRTMRPDCEVVSGPVWSCKNDPRQTGFGAVLRQLGVDELPQLWNVLKGEMSLVGPRPERPHFVHEFSQTMRNYPQRHQVVPGITGLAQVHGMRGATSIEKRLGYDLEYVAHWSLNLDLAIVLRTPVEILRGLYAS